MSYTKEEEEENMFGPPILKSGTFVNNYTNKEILAMFDRNEIDLCPPEQRGRQRWSESGYGLLIGKMMRNGIVPAVILIKNKNGGWNVHDGSHRLTASIYYQKGEWIKCEKNRLVMPFVMDILGNIVYYKKTESTECHKAKNPGMPSRYMTKKEQTQFNEFIIHAQMTKEPMDRLTSSRSFLDVNQGLTVTNNDREKNLTDFELIKEFHIHGMYEVIVVFFQYVDKDMTQYITVTLVRLYEMQQALCGVEGKDFGKLLTYTDKMYSNRIKSNTMPIYDETIMIKLKNNLNTTISYFSEKLSGKDPKLSLCLALAYHANFSNRDFDQNKHDIIASHILEDCKKEPRKIKKFWERAYEVKEKPGRIKKYIDDISNYNERCLNKAVVEKPRKHIKKNTREQVWRIHFENNIVGRCKINKCQNEIHLKTTNPDKVFHCGHIISDKHGGEPSLENLLPICKNCNLAMNTKNLLMWEKTVF